MCLLSDTQKSFSLLQTDPRRGASWARGGKALDRGKKRTKYMCLQNTAHGGVGAVIGLSVFNFFLMFFGLRQPQVAIFHFVSAIFTC